MNQQSEGSDDEDNDSCGDTSESEIEIAEEKTSDNSSIKKLSFIQLLRHFAVYTSMKHDHITYLLQLLKENEPVVGHFLKSSFIYRLMSTILCIQVPHYSLLPNTGKSLLKVDGRDWPGNSSKRLPAGRHLYKLDGKTYDGKYFHFGLEAALAGTSPGLVHRDADLIQYADLYFTDPRLIPTAIRKRVGIIS